MSFISNLLTPIPVMGFLFYSLIGFSFLFMGAAAYFFWLWLKTKISDVFIFLSKDNRFELIYKAPDDSATFKYANGMYIKRGTMPLSRSGKSLNIYSKDKPEPNQLSYNKAEWLTSDTLMATINNELVKLMVKPKETLKDTLLLMGSIGGMIAGLASVLILLKTFGVLK